MNTPVIISATRTAIGKFLGTLSSVSATDLGAVVVREAVKRANIDPAQVDEVIMGNVVSAALGQAPARQAALRGGMPDTVGALTINKVCGSGLKAAMLAAQAVALGDADFVVAGGMESMSNTPYAQPAARHGLRMGHGKTLDLMIHDGLWDPFNDWHMGNAGELVAEKYKISRETQDEFAYNSHRKAVEAINSGKFKDEIVPVEVPQRKKDPIIFDTDESPRADTTPDVLAKLRPAFKKDGTVTAGNAPGVNDGASAVVVTTESKAKELGVEPLARILGFTTSGIAPEMLLMAPVGAIGKLLPKVGWKIDDVDLVELNEAFSVQATACSMEAGIDMEKLNVNGGAVALGHPIGASGARVLTTLLYALKDRNLKKGIASLCLGGGNAVAMAVERY